MEVALNEQMGRYQEIRDILTQLANTLVDGRASQDHGTELQRAWGYLYDHCAECGVLLADADYAQVRAQELVRVGRTTIREIENTPICPTCYTFLRSVRRQFEPSGGSANV